MSARSKIFFDWRDVPDDGEKYVAVPKGNDRMWAVELVNFRRGGRVKKGTATAYRLLALMTAVARRHPDVVKSPASKPFLMRTRRAGPVVLRAAPLEGPVASIATKH